MGNNPQVTRPDIPAKFPGVLLESNHDGPTGVVETLVVDDSSAAAGSTNNAVIHHREDDPAGDQHPPLIVDDECSDDDDNDNNDVNSAVVNVLHVAPSRKPPVDEPIQARYIN